MGTYSDLLTAAIRSMIDVTEERDLDSLFTGGQRPRALTQTIAGLDDFELIAFLADRRPRAGDRRMTGASVPVADGGEVRPGRAQRPSSTSTPVSASTRQGSSSPTSSASPGPTSSPTSTIHLRGNAAVPEIQVFAIEPRTTTSATTCSPPSTRPCRSRSSSRSAAATAADRACAWSPPTSSSAAGAPSSAPTSRTDWQPADAPRRRFPPPSTCRACTPALLEPLTARSRRGLAKTVSDVSRQAGRSSEARDARSQPWRRSSGPNRSSTARSNCADSFKTEAARARAPHEH